MNNKIKHTGFIESIDGRHLTVKILQTSACASCKIASRCNASEMKEKRIDVYADPAGYEVGQQVVVSTTMNAARRALLMGFGLPLIILLAMIVGLKLADYSDEAACLTAIAALVPYYLLIGLLREKIAQQISFQIE